MFLPLTERQQKIASMVQAEGPISGKTIAERLLVTRSALRSDLAILTKMGILDAKPKIGYFYMGDRSVDWIATSLRSMKVEDELSQSVMISGNTSVYDAIVLMFTEDVGTLFVGSQERLDGVVSRKDLLKVAMGKRELTALPISLVMTSASRIIYVEAQDDILLAAEKMIDHGVDCLPVVDVQEEDGKKVFRVRGRISKTNITRLLVDIGHHVARRG